MIRRALAALRRSPIVAASLSFLLPGAGQAWAGAFARALLFVAPVVVLLVAAGATLATQGTARTLGMALQPGILLGFIGGNLLLAAWRVVATVDAYRLAARRWPGRRSPASRAVSVGVLVVLLFVTVGTHVGLGYVGYETYDAVTTVFATPPPDPTPTPGPTPAGPTPTPRPDWSPTPAPTPLPDTWDGDGRLDILLMGVDEGPGRFSLRPDAMILLSVDVATGQAAMFGIPRYLSNVPLPPHSINAFPCGCFPGHLNALFRYAEDNPVWFPGADRERGLRATQEAVGAMVGLHLDGRIVVNFDGFIRLVDALGGLWINVPDALYDARLPDPYSAGHVAVAFSPGVQWMDGWHALAYARTRHQDSDYDRLWRQEWVLLALRQQMNPCTVIPRVPELLQIAGDSLSISLPVDQLPGLLELAARVQPSAIARYQFWPPEITNDLTPDMLAIMRSMVREPFPAPDLSVPHASASPSPTPAPQAAPAPAC